jgi:hypothetical protein
MTSSHQTQRLIFFRAVTGRCGGDAAVRASLLAAGDGDRCRCWRTRCHERLRRVVGSNLPRHQRVDVARADTAPDAAATEPHGACYQAHGRVSLTGVCALARRRSAGKRRRSCDRSRSTATDSCTSSSQVSYGCNFDGCGGSHPFVYLCTSHRNRGASLNRWLRSALKDLESSVNEHPRECVCAAIADYDDKVGLTSHAASQRTWRSHSPLFPPLAHPPGCQAWVSLVVVVVVVVAGVGRHRRRGAAGLAAGQGGGATRGRVLARGRLPAHHGPSREDAARGVHPLLRRRRHGGVPRPAQPRAPQHHSRACACCVWSCAVSCRVVL